MTGYLVRRFIQMAIVVLLATVAIYTILNLAPGGPMAGLNQIGDRRSRFSEADKARLEAYLGLDRPLVLRYLTWLLGDDWVGADHINLALKPEEGMRFYADEGIAYASKGYPMAFVGKETGDVARSQTPDIVDDPEALQAEEENVNLLRVYDADQIWVRPEKDELPEGAIRGDIVDVLDYAIKIDLASSPEMIWVKAGAETAWMIAPESIPERPEGTWVSVGWLFGQKGLLGRYAQYHGTSHGILRLDFGTSWAVARGQPISMLLESRLSNTLLLMVTSTALSLLIAIPIGIYSAVKQYSVLDYIVTTFTFFGTAMPVFWLGLMLILIFSIKFQEWGFPYMPAGAVASVRTPPSGSLLRVLDAEPGGFLDRFVHLIMPTVVLALYNMASWSRFMRASMLEVLRQDYVRTARAKGLREQMVIVKHAMRNALIPLVTIVVFTIPSVFGGAIITETVFSWQGMGRLYYNALGSDDWPLVMVILFIQAVLTVIATLVGDVLYTVVDPRIRFD